MSPFVRSLFLLGYITLLVGPAPAFAQVIHEVFLANSEHELHVYRVHGREPGHTMMLIGGIQGDEPGSYLTADLYADVTLKRGNLIVVPRANFYSILLNRREGLTGDMNRKFGAQDKTPKNNMEEEVVAILKHLIAESDVLINLHEGTGFYAPAWISEEENPKRFGQSIIYDAEQFQIPGKNRTLRLAATAKIVIDRVNKQIDSEKLRFRVNNHDTLSEKSPHKEQRTSATYYALTKAHIPAFGVETSKSIESLETKVHLEKLVVNSFMEEFDILLDAPGVNVEQPKLTYVLIKVNGGFPYAVPHGEKLEINSGDKVVITDIIANYQRGLVADVEGIGTRNDANVPLNVFQPTRVVIRKDADTCGWVDLSVRAIGQESIPDKKTPLAEKLRAEQLIVNVDGSTKTVTEGQSLKVRKGARLTLQAIRSTSPELDHEIRVNLKGFTPLKATSITNDLNYPLNTARDLMVRFSENGRGRRYPIEALYKNKSIGTFWMELSDR